MRVFVTGATGFIGINLVQSLVQSDFQVDCLVRSPEKARALPQDERATIVMGSLSRPGAWESALERADAVIHLAGVTRAVGPTGYRAGNVETTRALMQALDRCGKAAIPILYVSSQAAAGPCGLPPGLDDSVPPNPVSWYGRSKLEAEVIVEETARGRTVILRPAMVFGPGDKDFLPLFKAAKLGVLPSPRRGPWPVSIVHVRDVVRFLLKALTDASVSGAYFLANDENPDWKEVLDAISQAMGVNTLILPVPLACIRAVTWGGGVLARLGLPPAYLNPDKYLEIRQDGWLCDAVRAHRVLGEGSLVRLTEGMRMTAEWYRAKGLV
jgi:nucleoside-diphosphate-sugar epimerase